MLEEEKKSDEVKEEAVVEENEETAPEQNNIDEVTNEVDDNAVENNIEESDNTEKSELSKIDNTTPQEKMLTQSQVNELVGRARQEGFQKGRESAMSNLYERYGVSDEDELNGIFGKGQIYDSLNEEMASQGGLYRDALAENALLKSKVNEDRWDDIRLILSGKGLDITAENIESMIPSHPEWRQTQATQPQATQPQLNLNSNPQAQLSPEDMERYSKSIPTQVPTQSQNPGVLRKLGNEPTQKDEGDIVTEEERAKQLFFGSR